MIQDRKLAILYDVTWSCKFDRFVANSNGKLERVG